MHPEGSQMKNVLETPLWCNNRVAERKLEDRESVFVISSTKYQTSRQDDFELAPEVFKNKVLTLQKQLTEKRIPRIFS